LGLLFGAANFAGASLELVTNSPPQHVFAGTARSVLLTVHNPNDRDYEGEIRARLFQTSSATAVRLSEVPWKTLRVLPGQTVLESARLDFPAVTAETKFLIQWLDSGRVLGLTDVWVFPTNLLAELKTLVGDDGLGVIDPLNQLKPLLQATKAEFTDLENADLEQFHAKLAIMGPFESREQMPGGLVAAIDALVKRNVAVVWLQPPSKHEAKPQPSFYAVPTKQVAVVVVQPALVAGLRDNPQAQLNLIYFCKMALAPQPLRLPNSTVNHSDP
jgi:hypothetical protein